MSNKFYVYGYYNNDDELFYVGKGSGTRVYNKTKRSKYFLEASKDGCYYKYFKKNISEEEAYELEEIIIYTYGLDKLANISPGGRYAYKLGRNMQCKNNPRYGCKLSYETKQKISRSHKNKPLSLDTKLAMSKARCFEYEINGILYESGIAAAQALGVSQSTISRWAKNNINNTIIKRKFYASKSRSKRSFIS